MSLLSGMKWDLDDFSTCRSEFIPNELGWFGCDEPAITAESGKHNSTKNYSLR